jgi:hypothetical protein
MIYEMFFGMTRSFGMLHGPLRLFVNDLLLVEFPILHSLLLIRRRSISRRGPVGFQSFDLFQMDHSSFFARRAVSASRASLSAFKRSRLI